MFIEKYFNNLAADKISFSRQQASDFAKQIADDFNPLHNVDAKRFCVPGDLLFAIILMRSGLYNHMSFTFAGMVSDDIELIFPKKITQKASLKDNNNKEYLHIDVAGEHTNNQPLIESLIKAYVEFSGHTFPHILVKLMAENNVMINPARPMVMYQSMSINMQRLDIEEITLTLASTKLTIDGKRGDACLAFDLLSQGKVIGQGEKHMLLSGLREYDQTVINSIVKQYNDSKQSYSSN